MNHLLAKDITITIGNKLICQDLTLEIRTGDRWGILGANGSGKTTVLQALLGLHPLREGQVFLNNQCLRKLSLTSIAQKIGILFQEIQTPLGQTVWDFCAAARYPHLAYPKKLSSKDEMIIRDALHIVELENTHKKKVEFLSGGEKKRAAIAALLIQTPTFYLLDEPINHLDIRHQIKILNHFFSLSKQSALIMSLHDINFAQTFCTQILLLFANGVTIQGSPDKVLTTENLTRLYQHPIRCIAGKTVWEADNIEFM